MTDANPATPASNSNPAVATPNLGTAALGPSGVVDEAAKGAFTPAADAKPADKPAEDANAKPAEKPAETKAEGDTKPEDAKKPEVKAAPDNYAEFKLPEGVKIDETSMKEFQSLAKGMNLPQDEAQKVIDLGAKYAAKWSADATAAIKATQTQWVEELKKDPQLGGDKLTENMGIAEKGLKAYDTDGKVSKLLVDTGLHNNVEIARLFHKIGSAMKEDKVVNPDQSGSSVLKSGGPGNLDEAAKRLYQS